MYRITHQKTIIADLEDVRRPNRTKNLITATRIRWTEVFTDIVDGYCNITWLKWIDNDKYEFS